MLIIRGVNLYPSQIEAALLGFPGIAPHYQLVLEREGALDRLTVEVEAASSGPALAEALRHLLKSRIGLTCEIAVKAPGAVPRSQGKAVRVRDLRPKP
jgi:phenylacetate-CoA ligase